MLIVSPRTADEPGKIGVSPIPSFLFVYPRFLASAVRSATSRARPESPTPPPWLLRRLCDQPPQNMSPLLLGSVQGGPPPSAASQRRPGPWPPPPPLPEDDFMDEVEEGTGEQGSSGGPVRGLDAVAAGRTSSFKPYHFLPRGITLV
uniref:Uncharacterized protein n=1 Tax=Setaria viridis TaxID=4556 RepID=A0A4U6UAJ2_SETVI|nr:hypothetical protein SEVIR_6G230700v2 [Setaria viridis]